MLEEEATLLERAERFQIVGSKCKEVATRDKERQCVKTAKSRLYLFYFSSSFLFYFDLFFIFLFLEH